MRFSLASILALTLSSVSASQLTKRFPGYCENLDFLNDTYWETTGLLLGGINYIKDFGASDPSLASYPGGNAELVKLFQTVLGGDGDFYTVDCDPSLPTGTYDTGTLNIGSDFASTSSLPSLLSGTAAASIRSIIFLDHSLSLTPGVPAQHIPHIRDFLLSVYKRDQGCLD